MTPEAAILAKKRLSDKRQSPFFTNNQLKYITKMNLAL